MSDDFKKVLINNPSVNTRYKPGECGNRKGRPKGAKNFTTVLENELKAAIPVTENKKKKRISKREAIAKQLVNKAISGDLRAIQTVMNETRLRENTPVPPEQPSRQPTDTSSLTTEEAARIYAEMLKKAKPDG